MQRNWQLIVFAVLAALLCACENPTFRSSVPRYPVRLTIDTRQGVFVHFTPEALSTYVIADREGYHYNGELVVRTVLDAYGYGGVVVYIDMLGNYNAFDLACPNCAAKGRCMPCTVDGLFAVCPECKEHYDLGSGTAVPTKGIANEYMLRIPVINSGGKLTINQ